MIGPLLQRWQSRSARERQAMLGGLGLLAVATCLVLVIAALQARAPLQRDVQALRAAAATMDQQAQELERLRRLPALPAPEQALRARVQAALDAKLPPAAATRLESPDPGQVVVVFETVGFAAWLGWVGDLATRQVRLESCRIDALPAPGQVRITATLVPSGPP
ncbi:type II secretion system protein M [Arenimonas aestuarii]